MRPIVLIDTNTVEIYNPFVFKIQKDRKNLDFSKFDYIIRDGSVQSDDLEQLIQFENIFYSDSDMDRIVNKKLNQYNNGQFEVLLTELDELDELSFGINIGEKFYILSGDKFYYFNEAIRDSLGLSCSFYDKCIRLDDLMVPMKELGMLDQAYSIDSFISYVRRYDLQIVLLRFMQWVYNNHEEIVYDLDGKYNNPYDNILRVEAHLSAREIYSLDIDKCYDYDLRFDRLPARYDYKGFYTTTGRIYSESNEFPALQTLQKSKRDILKASDGCYLIEFDFKSFEFDILCQLIGLDLKEDPHTYIFDKLVGIDHIDARKIGKNINYSFIYGMNENRLADMVINELGMDDPDFRGEFLKRLHGEDVFVLSKELESRLNTEMKDNIVKNYFGRMIHCKKSYAVLNNYIQSTATDILYYKMLNIIDMLSNPLDMILLQNHDSVLLQLSEDSINKTDLLESIIDEFNEPVNGLTGRIEYKYGLDWKNLS